MLNKLCYVHHALACLLCFFKKGFLALSFVQWEELWRDDSAKSGIITNCDDRKYFYFRHWCRI
jgi:hypothetical protein